MKTQPLHNRIFVLPDAPKSQTAGGIHLVETTQDKATRGTVVATGPGKYLENGTFVPVGVNVSDVVIYGKYSGTEVEIDGRTLVVLTDDLVIGKEVSDDAN